ncbi:MAG: peroxiredoxin [Pseudomonadota bacterium]|nr:peroxiredoxin [Pseudomonadota bacterium]
MSNGPMEGDAAPPFTLPADGGRRVSLDDFRDKKLVLYFYPKADTNGCTKEAQAFSALSKDFDKAGAAVVGVSADPTSAHDKFKKKYGLDLALASDESRKTVEDYGVWVEKSMYGRRYMGIERATFLIDQKGRMARVWRNVKVPGHAEEVLAAVRAMP